VTTAVVSDLHLGSRYSLVARREVRNRLVAELRRADRVVLLGDLLSLRDAPAREVLETARPFLDELGRGDDAPRIVVVPGNHDHRLARELLEGHSGPLALEQVAEPGDPKTGAVLCEAGVAVAYPGLWIRPDIYATHGHYLDCHLTFPRPESLLAGVMSRVVGRPGAEATPDAYEAAVAPLYAFAYARAQRRGAPVVANGNSGPGRAILAEAWGQLDNGRRRSARRVAAKVAFGGAVGALNLAGLGPLRADMSARELERAGVAAMAEVAVRLGVDSGHVIFGHTHRAGPMAGESWRLPAGGTLVNPGSWVRTDELIGDAGGRSPFWPGRCVMVEETGQPRLHDVLEGPAA